MVIFSSWDQRTKSYQRQCQLHSLAACRRGERYCECLPIANAFSWQELFELWKKLRKHCMLSEKAGKLLQFANVIVMTFSRHGNASGFLLSGQSHPPDDSGQEGAERLKSGWQKEETKIDICSSQLQTQQYVGRHQMPRTQVMSLKCVVCWRRTRPREAVDRDCGLRLTT